MESWLILVVVFGLFFLLMRRGGGGIGCCGGGHSHGDQSDHVEEKSKGNAQPSIADIKGKEEQIQTVYPRHAMIDRRNMAKKSGRR